MRMFLQLLDTMMGPGMKMPLSVTIALAFVIFQSQASGQTLTEQLLAIDAQQLGQQARESGDIVRGAILFHQGNINCAKCHRSSAEAQRLGPDLSKLGDDATDEHLVESILAPSKVIKDEYRTVTLVTLDGEVLTGLVVEEDDQQMTLRQRDDVDRPLVIAKNDIDEIQPSSQSLMPDKLADELKNRQQFLDLLRYVIAVKEGQATLGAESSPERTRRELDSRLQGLVLLNQNNCTACHTPPAEGRTFAGKQPPRLAWSARELNPQYIEAFVADPHSVKPGTSMPGLLHGLSKAEQPRAASELTAFLTHKFGNKYESPTIDSASAARGFDTFHSVGCVACHAPRDAAGIEQPLGDSQPLGPLHSKYSLDGLVEFLEDPLAVRASGHMPRMQLSHAEAVDLANFLLQPVPNDIASIPPDEENANTTSADPASAIAAGEKWFVELNCGQCHTGVLENTSSDTALRATDLVDLDIENGCLGPGSAESATGTIPEFRFSDADVQSLRALLSDLPMRLESEQQIDLTLATYNCTQCHERDALGGVSDERNHHFQTTNLNLGDQGRIPPALSGVGAKLKADWMRDVLVNGRVIRPYMLTRMPQHGEANIGHLVELFKQTDSLPATQFARIDDPKSAREQGVKLVGNQGLNCIACHTFQYKQSDTMPAVDLTEMAQRLEKDWFYEYMLAPQQFSPNTVMPSFWPGERAIRKDLEGEPREQLEAMWQYLLEGRQARMPSGVVRPPLEILATAEAVMLRRKYPGIGKRGIGVGYPGGVNMAYDAEQLRLGSVWAGNFAEASGVWRGQGSGNVRPLGRAIEFAPGPELDFRRERWQVDDGRPPRHRFRGYRLDDLRRPTFRYSFDEDVQVTDFFRNGQTAAADPTATNMVTLRREIELTSAQNRGDLGFRLAVGKKIESVDENEFVVDERLRLRIVSDQVAEIAQASDENQSLEIPLELASGEAVQLVIEYRWETRR